MVTYRVFFCTECGADMILYEPQIIGETTTCPICGFKELLSKRNISVVRIKEE